MSNYIKKIFNYKNIYDISYYMDYNQSYTFINSINFSKNESLLLYYDEIINFQNDYFIPAVSFDTAIFLNWLSNFKNPSNILEIGFGSGASALFIHYNLKCINNFYSIEKDKNRYNRGNELLSKYNINNIKLIHDDAFLFLKNNNEKYDFIFLDAIKKDYFDYLPLLKKVMNKYCVLIADNILFNGKILDDKVEDKYLNGVNQLKTFIKALIKDSELDTLLLNIGDGLSVSNKK